MTDHNHDNAPHQSLDPEQMQKLLLSTPSEFMSMLGQDLRQANTSISSYAMLLKLRSTELQATFETGELTEDECLDAIIAKANQIDRALNILKAYAHAYKG